MWGTSVPLRSTVVWTRTRPELRAGAVTTWEECGEQVTLRGPRQVRNSFDNYCAPGGASEENVRRYMTSALKGWQFRP